MLKNVGRGLALFAASIAAVSGLAAGAGPAAAVPTKGDGATTGVATETHKRQAPRGPFTVDGVRYAPGDIARFAGQDLYFVVDLRRPNDLVGYTKKAAFDKAVAQARAADGPSTLAAGQYVTLYSGDERTGDRVDVQSAWGVNNLVAVNRGCGLFGCAGVWNDVASSIYLNGRVTLYDNIEYGGSWLYFQGTGWANLSWYGFDNITSSVNVWW